MKKGAEKKVEKRVGTFGLKKGIEKKVEKRIGTLGSIKGAEQSRFFLRFAQSQKSGLTHINIGGLIVRWWAFMNP